MMVSISPWFVVSDFDSSNLYSKASTSFHIYVNLGLTAFPWDFLVIFPEW